jgi:hypothetical protein
LTAREFINDPTKTINDPIKTVGFLPYLEERKSPMKAVNAVGI